MREGGYKRMESYEVLAKLSAAIPSGIKVEVTNVETRTSTIYHAINEAVI
jgi:hypothetical protein